MTTTEQAASIINAWSSKNFRSLGALWGADDLQQEGLICWNRIEVKYSDLDPDRLLAILHTSLRNRLLSIFRKMDLEKNFSSIIDDDQQPDTFFGIEAEDAPAAEPVPEWFTKLLHWAETANPRQLRAASGARAGAYLRSICGRENGHDIVADIKKWL